MCVNHLNRCKTSTLSAGGWRGHMRLHPTKLLIWYTGYPQGRLVTYLLHFHAYGDRLSPEPAWRFIWFSCTVTAICIFSCYLDFTFSQNWGSLVQSGSWNVIYFRESWYLILTGDTSTCRMSTVHQLLILFFHWPLDGLSFCFGVVVTADAFHNKIRKVVSVQVCDPCRVDKMAWAPWGNPVGKNWHSNRLWIYTFIAGNSFK